MNLLEILVPIAQAATEAAVSTQSKPSVFATLGINWKLFLAQLINFGVILFVLYRYVFTPVGKKLEERREKIDRALKDAEEIEREKMEFEEWKAGAISEANKKAAQIVADAQNQANKEKAEAVKKTKLEQEGVISQAQKKIEEDKKTAMQEVKGEIAGMVTTATEKILREKLTDKKDHDLIDRTIKSIVQ